VGAQVEALEREVSAVTGTRHAIAVSSGTSALMLLLRALDLPVGSEVITPSFTFAATAHALLWLGLKPVFCDCDPRTFTMDVAAAESLVTENTSAIYPVCIFGVPGDLDGYRRLAERFELNLLYDTAQGLGSTYKGRPLGGFGAGEAFSMSPTKVVTSIEGGLVTTNSAELAGQLRMLRDYGKGPDGQDMHGLGLSARMTEFNALVGRWSLARINTWIERRTRITLRYKERLGHVPGIRFQDVPAHVGSCRNYVVITLDPREAPLTRDALYERLHVEGVQTKRYFYPAVHNQTLYRDIDPGCGARLPVTEMVAARAIALPMYSHMRLNTVDDICDRILGIMGQP
jgi:dTDP-4-amino-4,6-dideoxygalactose transaminase